MLMQIELIEVVAMADIMRKNMHTLVPESRLRSSEGANMVATLRMQQTHLYSSMRSLQKGMQ